MQSCFVTVARRKSKLSNDVIFHMTYNIFHLYDTYNNEDITEKKHVPRLTFNLKIRLEESRVSESIATCYFKARQSQFFFFEL